MPASVGAARLSPQSRSFLFQPDRASTASKRLRRMSAASVVKIGFVRSALAAMALPLWIAQSKPCMPSLRMTLSPWTMMSSPDSASKSCSSEPANITS
ncbi:hypothetical protein D3C81_1753090 [compost metagenome]